MLLHVSWHTPPISTLTEICPHSNPFLVLSVPSPVQNRINTGRYPTFHKIFSLPYSEPPGAFIGLPFFPFAGSKATCSFFANGHTSPKPLFLSTPGLFSCVGWLLLFSSWTITRMSLLCPARLHAMFDEEIWRAVQGVRGEKLGEGLVILVGVSSAFLV